MKSFYVTMTRSQSDAVRQEILRIDALAALQYRRDNQTLLHVLSAKLTEDILEQIPGVSHAVNTASLGVAPA